MIWWYWIDISWYDFSFMILILNYLYLPYINFIILFIIIVTDLPPILENHAIFYDDPVRKMFKIENDPNYIQNDHPIVWSNFIYFTYIGTKMSSKYLQPNVGLDADHYVRDFRVGLIEMKTTISLYRGNLIYHKKYHNFYATALRWGGIKFYPPL